MLNAQDAHNLLVLLNRCPIEGLKEAQLVAVLAYKLSEIKQSGTTEDADGENSTPTA